MSCVERTVQLVNVLWDVLRGGDGVCVCVCGGGVTLRTTHVAFPPRGTADAEN